MEIVRDYLFDVVLPLSAACVGGAVIGWEREARDKPAGLRTHMLVSLAAAAFMAATMEYLHDHAPRNLAFFRFDPTHVIAGIIGGVGFLGAGTIIESRTKVSGITTAAGIWVAAAIGTACGLKFYAIAVTAVLLALLVLLLIGAGERWLFPNNEDDEPTHEQR